MNSFGLNVAALVVTYNRKALLAECLAAIFDQDFAPSTIFIVDNASTDGTEELFSDGGKLADIRGLRYIRMNENLGGAGGFKKGIEYCLNEGCDWIWLMDDDCIAHTDTLSELVKALSVVKRLGNDPSFLASIVVGADGEPMNVPNLDLKPSDNGYPDWYLGLANGIVKIESATFVSLLINVRAVEKVGLPIANFFIWGDDTEYTTRLTHYYGPAFLIGRSSVLHKRVNAKSLNIKNETDPDRVANYHRLYRNNLIVKRFHYGKGSSFKQTLHYFSDAIKCLCTGNGGFSARLARSRAILHGTFEFLGGKYELEDLGRFVKCNDGWKS